MNSSFKQKDKNETETKTVHSGRISAGSQKKTNQIIHFLAHTAEATPRNEARKSSVPLARLRQFTFYGVFFLLLINKQKSPFLSNYNFMDKFVKELRKKRAKYEDCGYRIGWNQAIDEVIKLWKSLKKSSGG